MIDKSTIRKLLLMQIRDNGISGKDFAKLLLGEKTMLVRKGKRYFLEPKFRNQMKVVLTGGVFDILHIGHLRTLEEAKKYGDVLVVVVASDKTAMREKRKPMNNAKSRLEMIRALSCVDYALIGVAKKEKMVKRVGADVIVFGYDQRVFLNERDYKVVKLKKKFGGLSAKTTKIIIKMGI
ncbi:FAD synthase [Candidatus Anstonella stagnisolia]|nr:FAD synthase [Candidatus Anstonella stagnisolia]